MAACGTNSAYTLGCRCDLCRAASREYNKGYYLRNREARLEKARNTPVEKRRQYKAATLSKPEVAAKNRATALRWARENPERVKENRRRACSQRRSLVREAPKVKFTASKLQERMSYFGGLCYLRLDGCTVIGTQVDHVKPLSKGGSDMLCNLRPACESCNKRKSNKWPLEGLL